MIDADQVYTWVIQRSKISNAFIEDNHKYRNYVRCNTITPDGSTTTFALTNVLDNTTVSS